MALTYAHSEGRAQFDWPDIVEAMTTIESGTAQTSSTSPRRPAPCDPRGRPRRRRPRVHEGRQSTRLSIRKRGGSLGHHQAIEKEERFTILAPRGVAR